MYYQLLQSVLPMRKVDTMRLFVQKGNRIVVEYKTLCYSGANYGDGLRP